MKRVRHSRQARRDLIDLWVRIAAEDPKTADAVFDRLEARARILQRFPEAGPLRPAIAPAARALVEPPFLILYRVVADGVQIVRVLHGAQNIDAAAFQAGLE